MRIRRASRKNYVSGNRLNIMDWYVHQGHQYEFTKLNHNFYLAGMRNKLPDWNKDHRPLNDNVKLVTEKIARRIKFDVVIIRSPVDVRRYRPFIQSGAIPVAAIQTTNHCPLPPECKHVVRNSSDVMRMYKGRYPYTHHIYIVHGYDPNEFTAFDRK